FAFFNNVPEKGFVYNFGNEEPYIKAPLPEQQKRLEEFDRQVADAERHLRSLEPLLKKEQAKWEAAVAGNPSPWTITEGQVFHASLDGESSEKIVGCGSGDCSLPVEEGRQGKARRFDGKQFVEAAGVDVAKFNYRDPFTFAAWIKPESPKGSILSKAEDYFEGEGHSLHIIDGKIRLHITFRWTDLGLRVETQDPIRLNEWQHVLVTYDGSMKAAGVHIYINGKEVPLKILFDQCLWPLGPREPWRIGAGGGLRFQGLIDDVRIFNRDVTAEEAAVIALLDPPSALAQIPPGKRTKAQADKLRYAFLDLAAPEKIREARARLARLRAARDGYYSTIPTVMVMKEREVPRETFILKRGAYDAPGEKVTPNVPAVLPPLKPEWPRNRLGLARWLVDPSNPLTARAVVNRFWALFFGTGLVKTVEDFGSQGEWPIHPELLDWLAVEFIESGWNVKHILKTIVTSATYRQSSKVTPELLQRDPENRLFARGPRLRLSPEMIRDQALAVSGLLVEKIGGPSVKPYQPPGLWQELAGGKGYEPDKGEGLYRRSLYTYWRRTVAPPNMVNFDSPTRENCIVRETRTNTPLQALNLMNDVTYVEAARKFAERMLGEGGESEADRIRFAYRWVLARDPHPDEAAALTTALRKFESYYLSRQEEAEKFLGQGDSPWDRKWKPGELAAWAGVASIILNLDETITK
ncbi:MAG: DUF1553 domain-containing protein, partial [Bryobacteraceae bacterium]|nr:DUF1553 domain-containing protein [Bryobacteraceae bacterium]